MAASFVPTESPSLAAPNLHHSSLDRTLVNDSFARVVTFTKSEASPFPHKILQAILSNFGARGLSQFSAFLFICLFEFYAS